MPKAAAVPKAVEPEMEAAKLRGEIINHGSSWAALCLCIKDVPESFDALLLRAGVLELTGALQRKAFDACADGYSVFQDARRRHKL